MTLIRFKTTYTLKGTIAVMFIASIYFICKAAIPRLSFDDAYMFTRYAKNIVNNHNFGWNVGEKTYGCTSIAYTFFVAFLELIFPKAYATDEIILKFSSFFWSIMAILALYKSLKLVISNPFFKKVYLPELIILVILFMPVFTFNMFNGMDTTLSLFGNSLMIFLFLRYNQTKSNLLLVMAAFSSYLIFFERPDNGICMMLFPILFLWKKTPDKKPILVAYAVICGCLFVDCLFKYLYFGYIIPLPFYVKSFGLYDSYLGIAKWDATQYLRDIFIMFFTLIIVYILFIKKSVLLKTICYWLPFIITYAYFFTVVQIMGTGSRYYLPFIPFFVIALAKGLNDSFEIQANFNNINITGFKKRLVILILFIPAINISGYLINLYYQKVDSKVVAAGKKYVIANTENEAAADIQWWHSILVFNNLMKILPSNTVVAASEDGFIASDNMQMNVMDLSQLHDNNVLKKIPLASSIAQIQPDIIWLPHTDYPKIRYEISHSPELISKYDFYPEILSYGVAIKKTYSNYDKTINYLKLHK